MIVPSTSTEASAVVDAAAAPILVVQLTDHADDVDVPADAQPFAEGDREGRVVHPLLGERDHLLDVVDRGLVAVAQCREPGGQVFRVADRFVAVGEPHPGVRGKVPVAHVDDPVGAGEALAGEVR